MRKLLLLIPGVVVVTVLAVMALSAPSAQADAGPHIKGFGATPDACANCHRAHRGVAELLLAEEEEQLCLSCHGNAAPGSNLNVAAGTEELSTGALRGGGFETARINTTDPTYRAPSAFGLPETGVQCDNAVDDDGDTKINDGCPVVGAPETACSDAVDNDGDTKVNDGCPPSGPAEAGVQCWNRVDDDDDNGDTVVNGPGDLADDGCGTTATITALSSAAAQPTMSSHSVDSSAQTIWGNGNINAASDPGMSGFGLTCGKCHDPHGSGNYRILRTIPSGLLAYGAAYPSWMPKLWNDANNSGTIDAWETRLLADETVKTYTTSDYWPVENYTDRWVDSTLPVDVVDTETTGRQVGVWCGTCHTRYLAQTESFEENSGDAIFTFRHATFPCPPTTGPWSNGLPAECRHASGTTVPTSPATLSGACLKCHVSHGSNATMASISGAEEWPGSAITVPATSPYPAAVGPPETGTACKNSTDDDGDTVVNDGCGSSNGRLLRMDNRGICQKCHNK